MPVYWEDLWEAPLDEVRARYGVRALDRARFAPGRHAADQRGAAA
jgi:hypothetical protein